jgi:hypothetical protein
MPRGGLLQLLATQNHNMNLRNVSHEYHTYESQGLSSVIIGRIADIVVPEYLELHFSDPSRDNLQDVKKLTLTMTIGGVIIQQFPLSLLVNLNEPIICDGKMYINLCFDMLFGELKMVGLEYHEVSFNFINNLNNNLNCISCYGIVSKLTYVIAEERRNLVQNQFEDIIQQFSFIDVKRDDPSQTSDSCELLLPFCHISKGFFIECENVDNLNNLLLKFNNEERFNLNRFLIRTKCKKINSNLLYFPFNYGKEYTERTAQSLEGSPNLSRIDRIYIALKFDTCINNLKIYSLQSNVYRQFHSMGQLLYAANLCNDVLVIRNNVQGPSYVNNAVLDRPQGPVYVSNADYDARNLTPPTIRTSITFSEPIFKPITHVDALNCPILCEPIEARSRYMSCHQCVNNFSEHALKRWFESRRAGQKSCPLCRVQWYNFDIYINGESIEPQQEALETTDTTINIQLQSMPYSLNPLTI